jgi:uncharacterized protein
MPSSLAQSPAVGALCVAARALCLACAWAATAHADTAAGIAAYRAGDYGRAAVELREPAQAGDSEAQFHLGLIHALGRGVVADVGKAMQWYERAALGGHPKAQVNLALLLLDAATPTQMEVVDRARDWLERAARQGDPRAAHHLGLIHFRGHGVRRDYHAARRWWQEAATAGDLASAFNLGLLYQRGLGVERDAAAAVGWWQQAARGGFAAAQNALGAAYQNGDGAPFDLIEAWAWFRLAALGGVTVAGHNAELVASRLAPDARLAAEARLAGLAAEIGAHAAEPDSRWGR